MNAHPHQVTMSMPRNMAFSLYPDERRVASELPPMARYIGSALHDEPFTLLGDSRRVLGSPCGIGLSIVDGTENRERSGVDVHHPMLICHATRIEKGVRHVWRCSLGPN